jgi:hypothetical protein
VQVYAGPIPEGVTETAPAVDNKKETNTIAPAVDDKEETNAVDTEGDFDNQSPFEDEATRNTPHLFNSNPEGSTGPSATPNLDAFMRAFEAIDPTVYSEIETFLENVVPKLPENNNPITNHLESAVFLFELYEKMKEPRDLNNSQEQHFLAEIENFLASNSFLLFNKPTSGRQEQYEEDLLGDQDADEQNEQNQEYELNDNIQDNNQDDMTDDNENEVEKPKEDAETEKPKENAQVAA